jgi:hypothetical protein
MDFGISTPCIRVPRKDAIARRPNTQHQRFVRQRLAGAVRSMIAMITVHSMASSASVALVVSSVGELIRGTVSSLG